MAFDIPDFNQENEQPASVAPSAETGDADRGFTASGGIPDFNGPSEPTAPTSPVVPSATAQPSSQSSPVGGIPDFNETGPSPTVQPTEPTKPGEESGGNQPYTPGYSAIDEVGKSFQSIGQGVDRMRNGDILGGAFQAGVMGVGGAIGRGLGVPQELARRGLGTATELSGAATEGDKGVSPLSFYSPDQRNAQIQNLIRPDATWQERAEAAFDLYANNVGMLTGAPLLGSVGPTAVRAIGNVGKTVLDGGIPAAQRQIVDAVNQSRDYRPEVAANMPDQYRGLAGFAYDIASDPVNLLGLGAPGFGAGAANRAREAGQAVPAVTRAWEIGDKIVNAPFNAIANRAGTPVAAGAGLGLIAGGISGATNREFMDRPLQPIFAITPPETHDAIRFAAPILAGAALGGALRIPIGSTVAITKSGEIGRTGRSLSSPTSASVLSEISRAVGEFNSALVNAARLGSDSPVVMNTKAVGALGELIAAGKATPQVLAEVAAKSGVDVPPEFFARRENRIALNAYQDAMDTYLGKPEAGAIGTKSTGALSSERALQAKETLNRVMQDMGQENAFQKLNQLVMDKAVARVGRTQSAWESPVTKYFALNNHLDMEVSVNGMTARQAIIEQLQKGGRGNDRAIRMIGDPDTIAYYRQAVSGDRAFNVSLVDPVYNEIATNMKKIEQAAERVKWGKDLPDRPLPLDKAFIKANDNAIVRMANDSKALISPFWLTYRPQYHFNNAVTNTIIGVLSTRGEALSYLNKDARNMALELRGQPDRPAWVGEKQWGGLRDELSDAQLQYPAGPERMFLSPGGPKRPLVEGLKKGVDAPMGIFDLSRRFEFFKEDYWRDVVYTAQFVHRWDNLALAEITRVIKAKAAALAAAGKGAPISDRQAGVLARSELNAITQKGAKNWVISQEAPPWYVFVDYSRVDPMLRPQLADYLKRFQSLDDAIANADGFGDDWLRRATLYDQRYATSPTGPYGPQIAPWDPRNNATRMLPEPKPGSYEYAAGPEGTYKQYPPERPSAGPEAPPDMGPTAGPKGPEPTSAGGAPEPTVPTREPFKPDYGRDPFGPAPLTRDDLALPGWDKGQQYGVTLPKEVIDVMAKPENTSVTRLQSETQKILDKVRRVEEGQSATRNPEKVGLYNDLTGRMGRDTRVPGTFEQYNRIATTVKELYGEPMSKEITYDRPADGYIYAILQQRAGLAEALKKNDMVDFYRETMTKLRKLSETPDRPVTYIKALEQMVQTDNLNGKQLAAIHDVAQDYFRLSVNHRVLPVPTQFNPKGVTTRQTIQVSRAEGVAIQKVLENPNLSIEQKRTAYDNLLIRHEVRPSRPIDVGIGEPIHQVTITDKDGLSYTVALNDDVKKQFDAAKSLTAKRELLGLNQTVAGPGRYHEEMGQVGFVSPRENLPYGAPVPSLFNPDGTQIAEPVRGADVRKPWAAGVKPIEVDPRSSMMGPETPVITARPDVEIAARNRAPAVVDEQGTVVSQTPAVSAGKAMEDAGIPDTPPNPDATTKAGVELGLTNDRPNTTSIVTDQTVKAEGLQKTTATVNSVRDNPQQAKLRGDSIEVTNKVGKQAIAKFSISIDEWRATERHPNPNWAKDELLKRFTPSDPESESFAIAARVRDAQRKAIETVLPPAAVANSGGTVGRAARTVDGGGGPAGRNLVQSIDVNKASSAEVYGVVNRANTINEPIPLNSGTAQERLALQHANVKGANATLDALEAKSNEALSKMKMNIDETSSRNLLRAFPDPINPNVQYRTMDGLPYVGEVHYGADGKLYAGATGTAKQITKGFEWAYEAPTRDFVHNAQAEERRLVARSAVLDAQSAIRDLPSTGDLRFTMTPQERRAMITGINDRARFGALSDTRSALFPYDDKTMGDYLMSAIAPYPYWAIRHMVQQGRVVATHPGMYAAYLSAVHSWYQDTKDQPPANKWSLYAFTTPDGTQVRFRPQALLPYATGSAFSILSKGEAGKYRDLDWFEQLEQWTGLGASLHWPLEMARQAAATYGGMKGGPFPTGDNTDRARNLISQTQLVWQLSGGRWDAEAPLRQLLYGTTEMSANTNYAVQELADRVKNGTLSPQDASKALLSYRDGKPDENWNQAFEKGMTRQGLTNSLPRFLGSPTTAISPEKQRLDQLQGQYGQMRDLGASSKDIGGFLRQNPDLPLKWSADDDPRLLRLGISTDAYFRDSEMLTAKYNQQLKDLSDALQAGKITPNQWYQSRSDIGVNKRAEQDALKAKYPDADVDGSKRKALLTTINAEKGPRGGNGSATNETPARTAQLAAEANAKALVSGYFDLQDKFKQPDGSFDSKGYAKAKDAYLTGLSPADRDYVLGEVKKNQTPADIQFENTSKYKPSISPSQAEYLDKVNAIYSAARYAPGGTAAAGRNALAKAGINPNAYSDYLNARNPAYSAYFSKDGATSGSTTGTSGSGVSRTGGTGAAGSAADRTKAFDEYRTIQAKDKAEGALYFAKNFDKLYPPGSANVPPRPDLAAAQAKYNAQKEYDALMAKRPADAKGRAIFYGANANELNRLGAIIGITQKFTPTPSPTSASSRVATPPTRSGGGGGGGSVRPVEPKGGFPAKPVFNPGQEPKEKPKPGYRWIWRKGPKGEIIWVQIPEGQAA